MRIEIIKEDIIKLETEAIVNPANSKLKMGGGLAGIIKKKGGSEIEKEATEKAPINVGQAIITTAGDLPAKYVIHSPTMEKPTEEIPIENVRKSMRAILNCAEEGKIKEIAIPGLGTGVGGVSPQNAANAMFEELKKFEPKNLEKVIFVGYSEELYQAFKTAKKQTQK